MTETACTYNTCKVFVKRVKNTFTRNLCITTLKQFKANNKINREKKNTLK